MGIAAVGFIGYAVIFFVRNFTDAFLELGIGPAQVDVGRDQSGTSARPCITTSGTCTSPSGGSSRRRVCGSCSSLADGVRRRPAVGVGGSATGAPVLGSAPGASSSPLPEQLLHARPPRAHSPSDSDPHRGRVVGVRRWASALERYDGRRDDAVLGEARWLRALLEVRDLRFGGSRFCRPPGMQMPALTGTARSWSAACRPVDVLCTCV